MGLDAVVCCNCFETGALKEPPPDGLRLYVSADGHLECADCSDEELDSFYEWLRDRACAHEDCILLHHYLGNIARVGIVRHELEREAARFPFLLSRVVFNGVHAGDMVRVEELTLVRGDLDQLRQFTCHGERETRAIEWFLQQMNELVDAAMSMNKPIAF